MAFTAGNLVNLYSGPQGSGVYHYDAGSDSMATVIVAGYFNNTDDDINLAADDLIYCVCNDGDMILRVSAVSSGSVTTQLSSGMPDNGVVGSASAALLVGLSEIGTGTGSAFVLPTPYIGAMVTVVKMGTGSAGESFVTDATTVTLNGAGDRTITLDLKGQTFTLQGVSATRWRFVAGGGQADTIVFS